jgi:hypothetical protein
MQAIIVGGCIVNAVNRTLLGGFDGIITDYPGRLREVLIEKGRPSGRGEPART